MRISPNLSAALLPALLLAACGSTDTIVDERIVTVERAVVQPCAGARPAAVTTLREDFSDAQWAQMDARQKAAAVGYKALQRQAYAEQLDAATGACP